MNALEFHGVTKRYRKGDSVFSGQGFFRAVNDVTFMVPAGQTVGFVGHNGAGKTTLLRLAAGITTPTSGRVVSRGTSVPLIAMEGCLNGVFNAVDNARFLLLLHGRRPAEMRTLLPSIMEFSGLDDFPMMPVKHYSGGMRARLSFSIAVHLPMDTLIVDEVLSVGDEEFKEKCRGRIARLRAEKKTVLFVSHSLPEIQRVCDRVLWMEKGRLVMDGSPGAVIDAYLRASQKAAPGA